MGDSASLWYPVWLAHVRITLEFQIDSNIFHFH